MKSTDGMTALGTYAVSGLKTKPVTGDYEAGVVAGQDLPEAWWNFFLNAFTFNEDTAKGRLADLIGELSTVLASSGLTPDNATTTQVDAALKAKYMSRLGIVVTDFNALATVDLPQGSVTSFYANVGYTNGPAGATVQTGLILRSKVAADDCILLAFGNVSAIGVSNYPIYFRVRTAGTWLGWTSLLGGNNASSAASGSSVMLRDAAGRSKVVAPAAADDIALQSTVTTDIATHQAIDLAHSATSAATASKIMARDASGRAKVAAPAADDDIARKAEVTAALVVAANAVNLTSGIIPLDRLPTNLTGKNADTVDGFHATAATGVDTLPVRNNIGLININGFKVDSSTDFSVSFLHRTSGTGNVFAPDLGMAVVFKRTGSVSIYVDGAQTNHTNGDFVMFFSDTP